jgi:hypothetical protein
VHTRSGLFIAKGTSDEPLADIVEGLFFAQGVSVFLSRPDFAPLNRIPKDVHSRVRAGLRLLDGSVDVVVIHRDADNAGPQARFDEIAQAVGRVATSFEVVPIVPIRMTEAWLLLDEGAIRQVAGTPSGRTDLGLPNVREVERLPDPKDFLRTCILKAADVTGRRREAVGKRFPQHRRQLLEKIDPSGRVSQLNGWKRLVSDVDDVIKRWDSASA